MRHYQLTDEELKTQYAKQFHEDPRPEMLTVLRLMQEANRHAFEEGIAYAEKSYNVGSTV